MTPRTTSLLASFVLVSSLLLPAAARAATGETTAVVDQEAGVAWRASTSTGLSLIGATGMGLGGFLLGDYLCGLRAGRSTGGFSCFLGGTEGAVGLVSGTALGAALGAWSGSLLMGGRPRMASTMAGAMGGALLGVGAVYLGAATRIEGAGSAMVPLVLLLPVAGAALCAEYSHREVLQEEAREAGPAISFGIGPRAEGGGVVSMVGFF